MGLDVLPQIGFLIKTILGIGIATLFIIAIVYYVMYLRVRKNENIELSKEYQEYVATSLIFSILLVILYIIVAILGPIFSLIIS